MKMTSNYTESLKAHSAHIIVQKLGTVDDYIGLPVLRGEDIIGVITDAKPFDGSHFKLIIKFLEHQVGQNIITDEHHQVVSIESIQL